MSFIRPEVVAQLLRWREALAAVGVTILGLWALGRGLGRGDWLLQGVGGVLILGGAVVAWAAIQRARFRGGGQGPGLVRVTERQITYMGPIHGGAVALSRLEELALVPAGGGDRHWMLHHEDGPPLAIPLSADGAEALFDAFAALPGLDTARLVAAVERGDAGKQVIWTRRARTQLRRS